MFRILDCKIVHVFKKNIQILKNKKLNRKTKKDESHVGCAVPPHCTALSGLLGRLGGYVLS
jgi:hypothetical protein